MIFLMDKLGYQSIGNFLLNNFVVYHFLIEIFPGEIIAKNRALGILTEIRESVNLKFETGKMTHQNK